MQTEFVSHPFILPTEPEFTYRLYKTIDEPGPNPYGYFRYLKLEAGLTKVGVALYGENHQLIDDVKNYNRLTESNIPEPAPVWKFPYPFVETVDKIISDNTDLLWAACLLSSGSIERTTDSFITSLSERHPALRVFTDRYNKKYLLCTLEGKDNETPSKYRPLIFDGTIYDSEYRDKFVSYVYENELVNLNKSVNYMITKHNADFDEWKKIEISHLRLRLRLAGIELPD
jgi:hypothetical protein